MKPIFFSGGIGSNFYMGAPIVLWCPVRFRELQFASNEHYFHVCKVSLSHAGTIDMAEEIRCASHPREAKRLGRLVPLEPDEVEQWNSYDAMDAMLMCNLAKYQQHDHCRQWLLATGDLPLVEHRPDPIWGDNMDGTGRNLLGKTLELVRARVRGSK